MFLRLALATGNAKSGSTSVLAKFPLLSASGESEHLLMSLGSPDGHGDGDGMEVEGAGARQGGAAKSAVLAALAQTQTQTQKQTQAQAQAKAAGSGPPLLVAGTVVKIDSIKRILVLTLDDGRPAELPFHQCFDTGKRVSNLNLILYTI